MTSLFNIETIPLSISIRSDRRMDYYAAFGLALRELRTERHKSQESLAHDAGLHRTYISMLEKGECSPKLVTVFALSEALGISATVLVSRTETLAAQANADDDRTASDLPP